MIIVLTLRDSREDSERLISFLSREIPHEDFKILTVRDIRNIFTKINFLDSKMNGEGYIWVVLNTYNMSEKEIGKFLDLLDNITLHLKTEIYCLTYEDSSTFDQRAIEFLKKYGWV